MANGSMIQRATGTITRAPAFAGLVDLRYTSTAAAVIFVASIYAGWSHTANVASSLTPMLGYSVGWIFVSMPIGFALTLFHAAVILIDEGPEAVFRNATESVIDSAQA